MKRVNEARPESGPQARTDAQLLDQYGSGAIRFSGTRDALYERHLLFDDVVAPAAAGALLGATARVVRDVLWQRWVRTEETKDRQNPKRR